ncbi:DUF4835 family protein [Formosa sp. PL04]|uniref:type IX secretion system protein PorD n=1 Tax=Formosa sp. PL04 TaxID=3081755 RepID=UPI0029822A55|nr:DUF4835 family protein [Formosa sp. PL04]MDW5289413.1 DUF4835 family protein [Formosa sp. PL04]
MRNILFVLFLCISVSLTAQELNCKVVINAQQTGDENDQVFQTLEKQLTEFVNNTQWTSRGYKANERINCSMVIIVNEYAGDVFRATIQVQSSRPVYGSSYGTPIYNFNDKNFTFNYAEFQNLNFSATQYESNLVSVLAFHIYMILGQDADSFQLRGGDEYLNQAQTIVNYSQQEGSKGWSLEDGLQTRYMLLDNMLSPTFKEFREVMYAYHREGLDQMSTDVKAGKESVATSIDMFQTMNNRRPNSFLVRVFFDAKSDEIEEIFSDGPSVNVTDLVDVLGNIAPTYSSKWRNIKF